MTTPEDRCNAVGDLTVDGKRVGWLRCTEPEWHHDPDRNPRRCNCGCYGVKLEPTPHRAVLTWADDPVDVEAWPEALDLDEHFDVEVDVVEGYDPPSIVDRLDELVKQEARSTRPGMRCPERLPDGARCIATAGHDFGHLSAAGDRWGEPYAEHEVPTHLFGPGR